MTATPKPSAILLKKQETLEGMPEPQRQVVRQVMLGAITGLNEQHSKRWSRFINRLLKAQVGEVFHLMHVVDRAGGRFHAMHMRFEQVLFDRQERFPNIKAFRNWLKTGAGWCTWAPGARGGIVPVPRSEDFEEMSDDEMREVHEAMVAFMSTDHAKRYLWPHLTPKARADMLESVLERQEERQ